MNAVEKIFLHNRAWAAEKAQDNPEYFKEMAKGQAPQFLWIGCSDSRVPANEITNSEPGDIFVHRNIANMVVHTDLNLLSVIQYAVEVLKVPHVAVVGHYGCGGVRASLENKNLGLIDKWLCNIKEVQVANKAELASESDPDKKADLLVELNVKAQVQNLMKTSTIQKAWNDGQDLTIHGWVYGLDNGELQKLVQYSNADSLEDTFKFDF